jgi:DNA-binding MarR family transcriptional regulator/soluble P-type ATPase
MVNDIKTVRVVIFTEGIWFSFPGAMTTSLLTGHDKTGPNTAPASLRLLPGATETITLLMRLGIKLALLSCHRLEECKRILSSEGFPVDRLFFISREREKEEQQRSYQILLMIRECLEKMEVNADEAVYVGNSADDFLAGKMMGIRTVCFKPGLPLENDQSITADESCFPARDVIKQIYDWEKECRSLFLTEGIYKSFRGLSAKFSSFSERYGIPPAQMAALQKLRKKDGITISKLAVEMGLLLSSISGLVNRMAKQGLVVKRKDERDNRISKVYLTNKGREIVNNLSSFSLEIENYFEAYISKEDLLCFRQILRQMTSVLERRT